MSLTANNFYSPYFYVQGLASTGSVLLTASAPGYSNGTATITLVPSGFIISPGNFNFTTTTFSANTNIQISPAMLNATTLALVGTQQLRGGLTNVQVPVTSSNTAVGTITLSPVVFNGGDSYQYTAFHPLTAGTTNIRVGQPAGFSTPSNYVQITATVTP